MAREEEILKAGIDYTIANKPKSIAGDNFKDLADILNRNPDFEAGAKWADGHSHWISVEDKKPKFKHKNDGFYYSETVIVTDGEYRTSASWVHNIWAGWYCWLTDGDEELKGVTHWMPMPQAPTVAKNATVKEKGDK